MNIIEEILPYERDLFLWLNHCHTPFWDNFMQLYSGKIIWIPQCILLIISLFYKSKWTYAILFIVCFALLATLCDQVSASVIKPLFTRFRPTHHPDFIQQVLIVDGYRGGRYGFVSAHAANGFGVATFMALVFRYRYLTLSLFCWASISAYSRIYLGVHFISDIIGGILLGMILGVLVYKLFQFSRKKWLKENPTSIQDSAFTHTQGNIIIVGIFSTILFIILYSLTATYLL